MFNKQQKCYRKKLEVLTQQFYRGFVSIKDEAKPIDLSMINCFYYTNEDGVRLVLRQFIERSLVVIGSPFRV